MVTQILVEDLQSLVDQWKPGADNYRAKFVRMEEKEALGKILTGLATLSGFELASERIGAPLDSGSQEDEQSCFSDNTHEDYRWNVAGIYEAYQRPGFPNLLGADDPLRARINAKLSVLMAEASGLPRPMDHVLVSPTASPQRKQMEKFIKELQELANLFVQAGAKLGTQVVIAGE